jgi:formate-dependent nitrite reductase membrane component NrfD
MLIDVTPGDTGPIFKYWSPMSVGAWALFILGFFVTVSALEAYVLDRRKRAQPLGGVAGRAFNAVGAVLALFFASYTGVLLSVSNQPIWSDTWMLGGLFLASGLSGSAALMALLTRYRPETVFTLDRILEAEAYFSLLELVVFVLFFITIIAAGTAGRTLPLFPLWLLALAGIAASLLSARGHLRLLPGGRSAVIARATTNVLAVAIPVLVGVLALRAAVIFSAQ